MTKYEYWSLIVAAGSLLVATVTWWRTRKIQGLDARLTELNTKLAQREIDRIEESESLEGQPRFVVLVAGISGRGNPQTPSYVVRIEVRIDNTGENYLEPKGVALVTLRDGVFKTCSGASLEYVDPRSRDPILGMRTIVVKPGAELGLCKLHIHYVDRAGLERVQEFRVFPEGGMGDLPSTVRFMFLRTLTFAPSILWTN